jgi:hypothetical protein
MAGVKPQKVARRRLCGFTPGRFLAPLSKVVPMESRPREQREYELVRLLLGNRSLFREYCTTYLQLGPAETQRRPDRDLLLAVLNQEFPPLPVLWGMPAAQARSQPI